MLCFLIYTEPFLTPHEASSYSKQKGFWLQSGTLKGISVGARKADLILPSFQSILYFQGLLRVSLKSLSPMIGAS